MRRGRVAAWGAAATLLLGSAVAHAHPLGASSINRYEDFQYVGDGRFRVAYLLDFAEGPAYAEIDALDADHDGAVTPREQERYLQSRLPLLLSTCAVEIDGERVTPTIVASHLETPDGEGGMQTLRIAAELSAVGRPPSPGQEVTLHVYDDGFVGTAGWREIHAEDASVTGAAVVPDAGGVPARVTDARFTFRARSLTVLPSKHRFAGWMYPLAGALVAMAVVVIAARRRRRRERA